MGPVLYPVAAVSPGWKSIDQSELNMWRSSSYIANFLGVWVATASVVVSRFREKTIHNSNDVDTYISHYLLVRTTQNKVELT